LLSNHCQLPKGCVCYPVENAGVNWKAGLARDGMARYKPGMAKKNPKANMPPATTEKPKPANRHKGIQIPTRVPPEMYGVIEKLAERETRKVAQMGLVLIREALEARGEWPPPELAATK
jgi:hypothetical protein